MNKVSISSEQAMKTFASKLFAGFKKSGATQGVIYLSGCLGVGKTTFSQGFINGMDFYGKVKSPSYSLVEHYKIDNLQVYHFDFYRLNSVEELEYIGIRDYFDAPAFFLIEWPEKALSLLPSPDLQLSFDLDNLSRTINLCADSKRGKDALQFI